MNLNKTLKVLGIIALVAIIFLCVTLGVLFLRAAFDASLNR